MDKYTLSTSNAFIEKYMIKPYQKGRLDSLTFSVKDCIDVQNTITGFGNPDWKKDHPKAIANAVCVEALLSEGATCIGKTMLDEFTYSLLGENHFYGTPVNPQCPERVPGGSSSGAASSVACGIVDFALGTDTGGSVRTPASNCGIYGYRPTHGRIPTAGVLPLAPSFDTVGLFAKDFATLSLSACVLLGLGTNLPTISKPTVVILKDALENCEAPIQKNFLEYTQHHFPDAAQITLEEIFSSHITINDLFQLYVALQSTEVWSVYGSYLESNKPDLGPIPAYNFNQIAKMTQRNKLSILIQQREFISLKLQQYLEKNMILCFPTTPDYAPLKNTLSLSPEARKTSPYFSRNVGIGAISGFSRSPQITIPMPANNHPPIGISFLAAQNQDGFLFQSLFELGVV